MDDEKKVRLKGTPSQSISSEQGTDDMLHDLNQLSGDDLKAIHKEINPNVNDKPVEDDPRLSPRTVQYLKFVRELFGRTYDIFGSDSTGMTRDQLYQIYDEMDESTAYVTSALDILSDDATQPDDDGNLIYIETENNKVRTIIETLFEDLEIENRLSKWARAIAKYGDLFVRVYGTVEGDKKGITSIDDTIYPSRINRKDFRGKLVAFSSIDSGINDEYDPPWTYVHFRHKGDLSPTRNKRNGIGDSDDDVSLSSSYGQSILKAAVKVYTQLRFVENMILLSRLTNSVKRNIFAINVGETDPNSAFELIKNYSELLKKDINFKLDEDLYGASKHMSSYDEDIFLPVSDPKNDMTITSVGGDVNIPEQYDLEYLQNKLFAALKIPKAYLNYEQDLNARSTLIQLDIRYARSVAQLQTTIITGLTRMVKIHLAYMGIDPEMVDFEIKLTGVSAIDQESRLEQKSQRINAARDFWDIVVSVNDTLRDSQEEKPEGGTNPGGGGGPDFNIDLGGGEGEGGLAPPTEDTGETEDTGSLEDELEDLRSSDLAPAESPEGATGESRKRTGKIIKEGLMRGMEYNSPLDLEYLASKLFSEYLDLPEDEVKIIMRQETDSEKKESTKKKALDRHRHLAKHSIQDDVAIDYPTPEGRKLYESTVTIMQQELEAQKLQEDSDAIDMAD